MASLFLGHVDFKLVTLGRFPMVQIYVPLIRGLIFLGGGLLGVSLLHHS